MLKRRGFTLIELIVVLSILGILASVVMCSFNYHIKKSHSLKAVSGGTQVYNAFMWYYRENKSNIVETMAITYIEKASNYSIDSMKISNKESLCANIKYKYEDETYNVEIYPDLEKYFIKDKGNIAIYP